MNPFSDDDGDSHPKASNPSDTGHDNIKGHIPHDICQKLMNFGFQRHAVLSALNRANGSHDEAYLSLYLSVLSNCSVRSGTTTNISMLWKSPISVRLGGWMVNYKDKNDIYQVTRYCISVKQETLNYLSSKPSYKYWDLEKRYKEFEKFHTELSYYCKKALKRPLDSLVQYEFPVSSASLDISIWMQMATDKDKENLREERREKLNKWLQELTLIPEIMVNRKTRDIVNAFLAIDDTTETSIQKASETHSESTATANTVRKDDTYLQNESRTSSMTAPTSQLKKLHSSRQGQPLDHKGSQGLASADNMSSNLSARKGSLSLRTGLRPGDIDAVRQQRVHGPESRMSVQYSKNIISPHDMTKQRNIVDNEQSRSLNPFDDVFEGPESNGSINSKPDATLSGQIDVKNPQGNARKDAIHTARLIQSHSMESQRDIPVISISKNPFDEESDVADTQNQSQSSDPSSIPETWRSRALKKSQSVQESLRRESIKAKISPDIVVENSNLSVEKAPSSDKRFDMSKARKVSIARPSPALNDSHEDGKASESLIESLTIMPKDSIDADKVQGISSNDPSNDIIPNDGSPILEDKENITIFEEEGQELSDTPTHHEYTADATICDASTPSHQCLSNEDNEEPSQQVDISNTLTDETIDSASNHSGSLNISKPISNSSCEEVEDVIPKDDIQSDDTQDSIDDMKIISRDETKIPIPSTNPFEDD